MAYPAVLIILLGALGEGLWQLERLDRAYDRVHAILVLRPVCGHLRGVRGDRGEDGRVHGDTNDDNERCYDVFALGGEGWIDRVAHYHQERGIKDTRVLIDPCLAVNPALRDPAMRPLGDQEPYTRYPVVLRTRGVR